MFALGVLHWTEEETLSADMNAIAMANEGQWDFMLAVLETGGFITRTEKPKSAATIEKQGTGQTLSPALFKAMFAKPTA